MELKQMTFGDWIQFRAEIYPQCNRIMEYLSMFLWDESAGKSANDIVRFLKDKDAPYGILLTFRDCYVLRDKEIYLEKELYAARRSAEKDRINHTE